jgi:hypothetical protein
MEQQARLPGRRVAGGLAVLVAGTLALAACGNPAAHGPAAPAAPAASARPSAGNAIDALATQSGIKLQLSLGVTAKQLMQIDTASGGKDGFTSQDAATVVSSSVILDFNTGSGTALKNSKAGRATQFDFALQVGPKSTPIEIRYRNDTLYAHANVAGLLADFGQSASKAASFQKSLQGLDSFVPGISALGQNRWVSAQLSVLAPLLKNLPAQQPAANPAASQKLLSQLQAAFTANTTYVNAGVHGGRTEYIVSVKAHQFLQQAMAALPSSLSSLPGASSGTKALNGVANKVPAGQTVVVDLWVRNNKAQEIDIDLNQFEHKYSFAIPLRILISAGTPVLVPPGVTSLDLSKIPQLLGGLMGGLGGSPSAASA